MPLYDETPSEIVDAAMRSAERNPAPSSAPYALMFGVLVFAFVFSFGVRRRVLETKWMGCEKGVETRNVFDVSVTNQSATFDEEGPEYVWQLALAAPNSTGGLVMWQDGRVGQQLDGVLFNCSDTF